MTVFTEIKIKTVFAFISNPDYRIHLTSMTFNIFPYLLSGLHYQFNSMCRIMASDLQFALIVLSCKVAILTHTKMNTISTDKACTDYGSHITANAFVIIVSRKAVS